MHTYFAAIGRRILGWFILFLKWPKTSIGIARGSEPVTFKFEWNVKVSFQKNYRRKWRKIAFTSIFATRSSKKQLGTGFAHQTAQKEIRAYHHNSEGNVEEFVEPAQVKMSILDNKGMEVFQ